MQSDTRNKEQEVMRKHLVIATRGSRLALWQAEHVKSRLEALDPGLTAFSQRHQNKR